MMATLNAHDYIVGEVLTAATMDGVTEDLNALNTDIGDPLRIDTGEYTGDGSVAMAVTGVGFTPIWIWIVEKKTVHAQQPQWGFVSDVIQDDVTNCMVRGVAAGDRWVMQNCINSLDSDGFTVNDAGANTFPNTNAQVYNYMAIGED